MARSTLHTLTDAHTDVHTDAHTHTHTHTHTHIYTHTHTQTHTHKHTHTHTNTHIHTHTHTHTHKPTHTRAHATMHIQLMRNNQQWAWWQLLQIGKNPICLVAQQTSSVTGAFVLETKVPPPLPPQKKKICIRCGEDTFCCKCIINQLPAAEAGTTLCYCCERL